MNKLRDIKFIPNRRVSLEVFLCAKVRPSRAAQTVESTAHRRHENCITLSNGTK